MIKKFGRTLIAPQATLEEALCLANAVNSLKVADFTEETSEAAELINAANAYSKSTRLVDIDKLEKRVKVEQTFSEEIEAAGLLNSAKQSPVEIRVQVVQNALLKTLGKISVTTAKKILKDNGIAFSYVAESKLTSSQYKAVAKAAGYKTELKMLQAERKADTFRFMPSKEIAYACENLNAILKAAGVNAKFIAEPTKKQLKKAVYSGQRRPDAILLYNGKQLVMEHFGWMNSSNYNTEMIQKSVELAESFGRAYKSLNPEKATNRDEAENFILDCAEEILSSKAGLEEIAERYVALHNTASAVSSEQAIYDCFYDMLSAVKLSKYMPKTKIELFARA